MEANGSITKHRQEVEKNPAAGGASESCHVPILREVGATTMSSWNAIVSSDTGGKQARLASSLLDDQMRDLDQDRRRPGDIGNLVLSPNDASERGKDDPVKVDLVETVVGSDSAGHIGHIVMPS
jgi:hypothetical protein